MTNVELGKQIWDVLRTNLDFDSWYKDCFGSCIEDAANLINSGCCTFSEGSELEISMNISKDGSTHTFSVNKNNFIEYYGEEACFRMFHTLKDIEDDLINYAAGSGKSEFYNDAQSELFAEFDSKFLKLPCDADGANPEQEKVQNELIAEYAQSVLDLM